MTIPASPIINDLIVGDDYPLTVTGTLADPTALARATLEVKANLSDPDSLALIDVVVTDPAALVVNATTGACSLSFTLTAAQTARLVAGRGYQWGVTVVNTAGRVYSPVPFGTLVPVARLVQQP